MACQCEILSVGLSTKVKHPMNMEECFTSDRSTSVLCPHIFNDFFLIVTLKLFPLFYILIIWEGIGFTKKITFQIFIKSWRFENALSNNKFPEKII